MFPTETDAGLSISEEIQVEEIEMISVGQIDVALSGETIVGIRIGRVNNHRTGITADAVVRHLVTNTITINRTA